MSNGKRNPAYDTIGVLADLFPKCFAVFEQHRQPLKIGIHVDLLAKLDGAITPKECAKALRLYCANRFYLQACVEGAPRIDLDGNTVGHVTAEEAANAKQRLAQRQAKQARRQEALAKEKAKAEAVARNAGRISLADLRKAAQARRAAMIAAE
jgi:ProP effector